jgi:transcription factor TFIIIB component B''
MSSMFKKKGGLAFKPKIPAGRSRQATTPASVPASKYTDVSTTTTEPQIEPVSGPQSIVSALPPAQTPPNTALDIPRVEDQNEGTSQSTDSAITLDPTDSSRGEAETTITAPSLDPSKRNPPQVSSTSTDVSAPLGQSTTASRVETTASQVAYTESIPTPADSVSGDSVDTAPQLSEDSTQRSRENATGAQFTVENITPTASATSIEPATNISTSQNDALTPATSVLNGAADSATPQPATTDTEVSITPAGLPATVPKKRGRKRKTVQPEGQDSVADGDDVPEDALSSQPKKRQRKSQPRDGNAQPRQTRRPRAGRDLAQVEDGGTGVETSGTTTSRQSRKQRSVTPEDAENQVVDLQKLKMSELTKDLHIGKKFSRHEELLERERQRRAKYSKKGQSLSQENSRAGTPAGGSQGSRAGTETPGPPTQLAPTRSSQLAPAGPQFQIIDGQIVVDQSSLVMDRHARAAAEAAADGLELEEIEENDFTRLTTSNSYRNNSKLRGPNVWTELETEQFYRALRMIGTDFEMIAKMFPGKTRRSVKMKFNREEKVAPQRIDAALIGEKKLKMDLDEYKDRSGLEFEPVDTIMAQQQAAQDEYDAERQRAEDEQAEIMRKKREELFSDAPSGSTTRDTTDAALGGGSRAASGSRYENGLLVDDMDVSQTAPTQTRVRGRRGAAGAKGKGKKRVETNMRGEVIG